MTEILYVCCSVRPATAWPEEILYPGARARRAPFLAQRCSHLQDKRRGQNFGKAGGGNGPDVVELIAGNIFWGFVTLIDFTQRRKVRKERIESGIGRKILRRTGGRERVIGVAVVCIPLRSKRWLGGGARGDRDGGGG